MQSDSMLNASGRWSRPEATANEGDALSANRNDGQRRDLDSHVVDGPSLGEGRFYTSICLGIHHPPAIVSLNVGRHSSGHGVPVAVRKVAL